MNEKFRLYLKLFFTTFTASAFTFGGGHVIIAMLKRKFVDEFGWLEDDEMMDMSIIAQSAPGPIAVNTALLCGYRVGGVPGAVAAVLGAALPPLIILSLVSVFYSAFQGNPLVANVLKGAQAGVAAVVADVVMDMGGNVVKGKNPLSIGIMTATFIATYWLKVNVAVIILVCGLLGLVRVLYGKRAGKESQP